MPCCDPSPYYKFDKPARTPKKKDESKKIENLRAELASLGKKYNELRKRADNLTQLLCYACGTLEDKGMMIATDQRLIDWFEEHNEWDFNRTLGTMKKEFADSLLDKETIRRWFIRQAEDVHPLSTYHRDGFFDRVYDAFIDWKKNTKNRDKRIADLEAELAKLKAEV